MEGTRPIEDKLRENRLRWFDHRQWRLVDATARMSDTSTINENDMGRGKFKLTWDSDKKNIWNLLNLVENISLDVA